MSTGGPSDTSPMTRNGGSHRGESESEWKERIRQQVMRDHPFVGEGPYCEFMGRAVVRGSAEYGFWAMSSQCGYPPDTHPMSTPVPSHGVPGCGTPTTTPMCEME
jgi:hypothetical protein